PVLSVDLKSRQLTALAAAEAGVIEGALRDFYQGGDKDEERAVKEALAGKILAVLKGLALEKRRFGQLLRALQMSDDECRANYDAPLPEAGEAEKTSSPPAPAAPAAIDLDALLGFGPARPEAAAPPAPGNDAAGRFRRRVELAWFNRLDELAADARRQRYFSLPRELFQALVDEIGQGARRLKVLDEVEARLREATSYSNVNPELVVWKQARLAAEGLNSYINWLGLSPLKLDRRGRTVSIRGHEALLFEPPEPPGEIPQLPDQQGLYDLPYFQDWARAFHRLMIHNVDFAEKTYDPEQNARLGAVLKGVSGVREAWR
ncbi:MAG: putative virulence factor, partial [Candidatus Adiutrix sp.]|nr:putative virulence factor [Candidatus Adiutrix sp.]